ncbi:hypothetical protein D3C84_651210 [compost metagenome]
MLGQLPLGGPHAEQRVTGFRLGFTCQPELVGVGVTFGFEIVADLVLRVQAVQFGEIHFRIVVLDEGRPVAAVSQPAQPAQFHPVRLWQVAMLGKELLDFGVARGFQACGQFVVGQIGFQRIIGERLAVPEVRPGITLGQGALGFIVILALGGQVHRLGGLKRCG